MNYSAAHLQEAKAILDKIDTLAVEKMAELMVETKTKGGRLFFWGWVEVRLIVPMRSTTSVK